ncbi:MAG TPA: BrnA antitoxin family protein [Rhodanobacteraceae bacterium]|nr:BrnA antitoxin family protein [Rhodanobacteraceae bacterium]
MRVNERITMKFKLDPKRPKPLTSVQRKRLQAAARKSDKAIDYSDIPAVSPEFWATHRPTPVEPKAQVTLRIDQDVLDYFKRRGKGYQTRINEVLRSFVHAHTR